MTVEAATLAEAYAACRQLAKRHGTTYYWSSLVLPAVTRHHVWALYAFCRHADDIVDCPGADDPGEALDGLAADLDRALVCGSSVNPILHALAHTVRAFELDRGVFERFLRSMRMDLTIDHYDTWDDLLAYTDGSAAVIGEMMLPILEPGDPAALRPARDLGHAFQLTNFLRDVGEDLDRHRVYIPQEDLERFGADPARRRVDDSWVELMRFEIARCRALYRSADEGIALLPATSARCVGSARRLYSEILDRIERAGYDVFTDRVRVPLVRKLAVAGRAAWPALRDQRRRAP